ncbi:hypothetical protein A3B42_00425 [Candidatus Daviesbacteria bacterium RIFCSPLOWO2_01_FULL_38_10]|nr:MAG: hypothetical protein A3B42_00425 [Candidatus Daviesbacteria bacterium RIFCSPLOWO2_01_FULL_38_10]OGE44215.1 MAG: hypothetical protein A3E67_04955 [Candidatus Daviesbacteria bacterium RIFCSPHIGHO2_12_FULL_38_25]OGE68393.1 MAG: hypothetical protein A3H81_02555 [Candidatus Daviesbacteria bacterium RIFCSPLOWO2_02_FULL_38_18]OGE72190.1 MAG: hypothetical protein A3H18_01710 [Candidatus Daviesbacteria bacterium RIFCSPLOWO2_12_FULL_38_10]HBQ50520.1 hypothetical protein [Candidatus Daviesbacteria
MQLVTVGSRYQIVIPKEIRKKINGLKPGVKVAVQQVKTDTATIKISKKSWSDESYGFMKEAWKDIDPVKEIDKMRDEWDELKKI